MRQVMPHRNNIVARADRCKSFLLPAGDCPLNRRRCGIPITPAHSDTRVNNVFISTI